MLCFEQVIRCLQSGDTFMIKKMDRAFSLDRRGHFEKMEINFIALTERMDTPTSMGKCMYHVRNAFSAMERDLLSERTKAGMEAARKRGK